MSAPPVEWENEADKQTYFESELLDYMDTVYDTALTAPFVKKAGCRYAVALAMSGASVTPTLRGMTTSLTAAELAEAPRLTNYIATASLVAFYEFGAGFLASGSLYYAVLLQ